MTFDGDRDDNNFLSLFRDFPCIEDPEVHGVSDDDVEFDLMPDTIRPATQALPASGGPPRCLECGKIDGPEGGGRYGFADHKGCFYCGRCWKAWDLAEQAKIMRPAYLQNLDDSSGRRRFDEGDPGNFFDGYRGPSVPDCFVDHPDIDECWKPELAKNPQEGVQALPASWKRPVCNECGKQEGDNEGGRYRRDKNGDKFFCGRCWRAWDVESRRKMTMAYAPVCSTDFECPPPEICVEPIVDCPEPDFPSYDDEDEYCQPAYFGDEDFEVVDDHEWTREDVCQRSCIDNFNMPVAFNGDGRSTASNSSVDLSRDCGFQEAAVQQTAFPATKHEENPVRSVSLYSTMQTAPPDAKPNGWQHLHQFSTSTYTNLPVSVYATGVNSFNDPWRAGGVG